MSIASVVVPSWLEFERLANCLEALGNQTIRDRLEIVVSLDGGPPLPEELAGMVDLVVDGPHAGPAAARNRGWRAASGEYILFTDSDCIPEPDWARIIVETLETGADAVKGVYSSGGSKLIQRLAQIDFEERYILLARARKVDMIDTYSSGFRRSVLFDAGGFDESFPVADHEDVDLSYRLASVGRNLVFQPSAAVAHEHRDSWLGYFGLKFSRGKWRMRVVRNFPGKAVRDSYTPVCLKISMILAVLLLPVLASLSLSMRPLVIWAALFLASCLPLMRVAFLHDAALAPIIPMFVLWRGLALVSGSIRGIFSR